MESEITINILPNEIISKILKLCNPIEILNFAIIFPEKMETSLIMSSITKRRLYLNSILRNIKAKIQRINKIKPSNYFSTPGHYFIEDIIFRKISKLYDFVKDKINLFYYSYNNFSSIAAKFGSVQNVSKKLLTVLIMSPFNKQNLLVQKVWNDKICTLFLTNMEIKHYLIEFWDIYYKCLS